MRPLLQGGRAFVSDIGEVEAKEGGVLTRLSEELTLCELSFAPSEDAMMRAEREAVLAVGGGAEASAEGGAADAEGPTRITATVRASASGVFNCVAVWYVLHLTDEISINTGPSPATASSSAPADTSAASAASAAGIASGMPPGLTSSRRHVAGGAPLPYTMRARAQRLHFIGYERRLGAGESVGLHVSRDQGNIHVAAPPDPEAESRGDLVRWLTRNSLGYHFSMIADTTRNGCFDRAIVRALATRPELCTHVLDIGSGSGLLAMMAVRAGAERVSSLEMVPAMAAVARHCVRANCMSDRITVHEMKSTDIEAEALGGRAGLLVCELVDNELLGEGTLFSIADARKRLLTPTARVVPKGGALFAIPMEMRIPKRGGCDLDELKLFNTDACFREGKYSNDGRKMQLLGEDEWSALGPPLQLFSFDWESDDVDTLCDPRVAHMKLTLTASGTLNAFLIYFHLHCDADEENEMSTGPDDVCASRRLRPSNPHLQPITHLHAPSYLPALPFAASRCPILVVARQPTGTSRFATFRRRWPSARGRHSRSSQGTPTTTRRLASGRSTRRLLEPSDT